MSNLKKVVLQDIKENMLKKKAKVIKIAENGPSVFTAITDGIFSMMDKEILQGLINQELTDLEFETDGQKSFLEWTIDAEIKDDEIEVRPIIRNAKIVGTVIGWTKEEQEVKIPNIEIPITKDILKVGTFHMEDGKVKVYNMDFWNGVLEVNFWDK